MRSNDVNYAKDNQTILNDIRSYYDDRLRHIRRIIGNYRVDIGETAQTDILDQILKVKKEVLNHMRELSSRIKKICKSISVLDRDKNRESPRKILLLKRKDKIARIRKVVSVYLTKLSYLEISAHNQFEMYAKLNQVESQQAA